jgi:hypothetical protein
MDVAAGTLLAASINSWHEPAKHCRPLGFLWLPVWFKQDIEHLWQGYRRNASSRRVIRGKVGTYLVPVQALAEETLYL